VKCPKPDCQSERVRVLHTASHDGAMGMTNEFRGGNYIRRRKICSRCGGVFFTIELEETDFRKLLHKAGTPNAMPQVRPSVNYP